MNSKSGEQNIDTLKLNIENNEENKFQKYDDDDSNYNMNVHVRRLEIIQRRTSKSLLRAKYKQDRIQVILFFVGLFGLPIISWGISWIIGKTCVKPKSHRGKKLRQLNGILTLIFIFVPAIFSYLYYETLGKFELVDNEES